MLYLDMSQNLVKEFTEIEFLHIPRDRKKLADVLSNLASILKVPVLRSHESVIIEKKKETGSLPNLLLSEKSGWNSSLPLDSRKGSFED